MKKILIVCITLAVSAKSFALFDPFSYVNYIQDLKTAYNTSSSLYNQARQIQNQVQQIQYEAKNAGKLTHFQYNKLGNLVQQMDQITQQGKAVSYSASNIDQQFKQAFPDYADQQNTQNYQQTYKNWNETTLDSIRNTLQAGHMSAEHFQNESQLIDQLRNQGKSATGRMQVMQVSTELASENVNQLQELKRITLSQENAQSAYMAYRVSKDSYHEKSLSQLAANTPDTFPGYQNNDNFGLMNKQ